MSQSLKFLIMSLLIMLLAACSAEAPAPEATTANAEQEQNTPAETAPSPTNTPLPLATSTPSPALPISLDALAGNWLGAIYLDEKPVTLTLNVTVDGGTATARPRTLGYAGSLSGSQGSLTLVESDNTFYFDSELGRDGAYQFTGQLRETGIEGSVVGEEKEGSFYLVPLVEPDDLVLYTGLYQFEDGRTLDISFSPAGFGSPGIFLPGLWLVNFTTGAYRALSPVSENIFYAGPSLGIALPATDVITFQSNEAGQIDRLMIQSLSSGQTAETALRQNFPTEDITFVNEGVELAGTITVPLGKAAEEGYPAVVLVHGSGRSTRHELERFTRLLASEGFAVLAYDKRGVGESGGSYTETASETRLLLLASDAAAGVDYMRERPDINPEKVGLLGGSQAGWIIPAAAVQSGHVAFMVNLSGPVVTVGQEGIYSAFTGDGTIEPIKTGEEIADAVIAAAGRGFDPLPYIAELDIPGLWLFGAKDMSVPIAQSAENLQEIIDKVEKPNYIYMVFPNGDHALWESESGSQADWSYVRETVPGYFDILKDWLRAQL